MHLMRLSLSRSHPSCTVRRSQKPMWEIILKRKINDQAYWLLFSWMFAIAGGDRSGWVFIHGVVQVLQELASTSAWGRTCGAEPQQHFVKLLTSLGQMKREQVEVGCSKSSHRACVFHRAFWFMFAFKQTLQNSGFGAIFFSCVHHPINKSSPHQFCLWATSSCDWAGTQTNRRRVLQICFLRTLCCLLVRSHPAKGRGRVVPESAGDSTVWPYSLQVMFLFCLCPVFLNTRLSSWSCLRIIHTGGMLLELVWFGFLRYDPFVVLPDLVVMEIPSIAENWLNSQDL